MSGKGIQIRNDTKRRIKSKGEKEQTYCSCHVRPRSDRDKGDDIKFPFHANGFRLGKVN